MLFQIEMRDDKLKKRFIQRVVDWFNREYPLKNRGDVSDAAKRIGVSQGQFSNIIAGRKCPKEEKRIEIASTIGINYADLIGELSSKDLGVNEPVGKWSISDPVEKKHIEIIPGFKNKPLALEINRQLQKIENYDPDKLEYINSLFSEWLKEYEYHKKKAEKPERKIASGEE